MKHRKGWFSHQKRHTVILKKMHSWHLHFHQNRAEAGDSLNLEAGLQENKARQAGAGQPADGAESVLRGDLQEGCGAEVGVAGGRAEQTWPAGKLIYRKKGDLGDTQLVSSVLRER